MRFLVIFMLTLTFTISGFLGPAPVSAEEDGNWVKYVTWSGEVDEMLVLRFIEETVRADFPVSTGFKNASFEFFAGDPISECAAKVEVKKGRGNVAIRKQYWMRPDHTLKVQVYDPEPGYGEYEFTVYYREADLKHSEKKKYQDLVAKTVYIYDVYHLDKSRAANNLVDALRWARGAYEINRLNWDMLNIIGELNYLLGNKEAAIDAYIVLRDNGYLTEENQARFEELDAYEASKKPGEDDEEE